MFWRGAGPSQTPTGGDMDHSPVLLILFLAISLNLLVLSSGDEVKHKKVIIKVPKKINHVHHHHIKKVHIWKHKPKPVHSVHIVEEDEHQSESHGKKHKKFSGWKDEKPVHEHEGWEEEEEDYEDFHEEDIHKKSGSHFEPVVWKGGKGSRGHGSSSKKYRESSAIGAGRGRGKPRGNGGNYKGERAKRQKNQGYHEDRYQEEVRYPPKKRPQGPPKGKKSNKSNRGKGSQERPRQKPKPYRPIEKGYADYEEYEDFNRESVWPERKEHISWHQQKPVSEEPYFYQGEQGFEHKGEIDLSKKPDIPIVPPPNLVSQYQPEYGHTDQSLDFRQPEPPKPAPVEYRNPKPASAEYRKHKPLPVEYRKPKPAQVEYRKPKEQLAGPVVEGFHQLDQHNEGTLAGYSSHVGHNAEGNSASFQSVRFGEKPSHHH